MTERTVTFITGGNKGLGYETTRRVIEAGHTVYIGARDAERSQAAADALGAQFVRVDVTDDASVDDVAAELFRTDGRGLEGPPQERERIGMKRNQNPSIVGSRRNGACRGGRRAVL